MKSRIQLLIVGFALLGSIAFSQTAVIRTEPASIPVSSLREDVKAIGMGKTQIGNGMQFNAMMHNPALLAGEQTRYEVPGVQASLPTKSFTAISFLSDNRSQFTRGTFIAEIKGGVSDFQTAQNDDGRLAALRRIQTGLRFISDLQENVGGAAENPKIHGIRVVPSLQGHFGNFGISIYGIAQTAFTMFSSQAITELAKLAIPQSPDQVTPEMLNELRVVADALVNPDGTLKDGSVPTAIAVSYIDLVGAAGYGMSVTDELSIGANLKLVNRRFSSKLVEPGNYGNILKEVRSDFNNSTTGVTADVGGVYRLRKTGTQIGIAVQNIIPFSTVSSDMKFKNYTVDVNGNASSVDVIVPFELKLPLLLNIGAAHPLTPDLDVALDVADLAAQDDKYEEYIERLRLGAEYRLRSSPNGFGAAFRLGLADLRPTFGIGLNLFRVVQIDGAYAYDNYVGENSFFAQVKFGW